MKKFIGLIVLLIFLGCPEIEKQVEDWVKENPFQLEITLSAKPDYIDSEKIGWYAKPPVIDFTAEGKDVVVTAKVNGEKEVVVDSTYQFPKKTGIYLVLIKATDFLGRSSYKQVKLGVDVDKPIIGFVNTSDTVVVGQIAEFVDNVPDNAMSDVGSGLNLTTQKGYWQEGESAVNASVGQKLNRIFEVQDNVGNKAQFKCEVIVADRSP